MREEASELARRRLSKDERRARILEAAARVFAERGYESASLEEIAEAAEITKPVIYDHFDSKKALHIALLEQQTQEMLAFWGTRVGQEESAERQLAVGIDAFLEFVETHPYAWRLLFRDPTAADADIVRAQGEIQRRATAAIAAVVSAHPMKGSRADRLDDAQRAEIAGQVIKSAANGVAAWWYEHREVPREALVEVMMGLLWLGMARVQAGERWLEEAGP